jgi:hypothetical protein
MRQPGHYLEAARNRQTRAQAGGLLICDQKWREAMTGSLSLYDKHGERLHTIYVGAAPEYGKETFFGPVEF